MKVLLLGNSSELLINTLRKSGDECLVHHEVINVEFIEKNKIDFVISYGYRHLIKKDILDMMGRDIINLHISLLPWNRGADPNLWSFLENTPKGVSIHLIDEGLDTGDIIAQKEVSFSNDETLASSYQKLQVDMVGLFDESWSRIRERAVKAISQPDGGSFHRVKDKEIYKELLVNGWDTPVSNISGKAKQ